MNSKIINPKRIFKRSWFFLGFGLIWIVLSVPFIFFAWHEWKTERRYESEAVKTSATVIDKRKEERWNSSEKRNDRYYYVRYGFQTASGEKYEQESSIFEDEWQQLSKDSVIGVEYLPETPNTSRIEGMGGYVGAYLTAGFGVVLFLTGIFFSCIEVRRRLLEGKLLNNGLQTTGTINSIVAGDMKINGVSQLRISYSFNDKSGRTFAGIMDHVKPALVADLKSGSLCRVCYDREEPSRNILL